MKLAFDLIITLFMILLLSFQVISSTGNSDDDLVHESCREASKSDPANINYDFCVSSLLESSTISNKNPPRTLQELVAMPIQISKSNATSMVSTISNLLKDPISSSKFSDYAKKCLQDCSELYSDSLSDLDDAIEAFKSEDFNSASTKISAAMDASVTCEDQFKDGNETSPLTQDNKTCFELNAISLAFIHMQR